MNVHFCDQLLTSSNISGSGLVTWVVCHERANPGDVLLTFVNQLNYLYQCTCDFKKTLTPLCFTLGLISRTECGWKKDDKKIRYTASQT